MSVRDVTHDGLFFRIDAYDYRLICFFSACLLYALFSSPTPDHFGPVEAIIAALLFCSIGFGRLQSLFTRLEKQRFWKSAGQIFMIYGLTVPIIGGVIAGHNVGAMFRDIVPFLLLFLPLFLLPLIRARPHYFRSVVFVILLLGLIFSLRSLVMHFGFACAIWCGDSLLYLENMPTVLFSALFLVGAALRVMSGGLTVYNLVVFCALLTLSLLPITAMVITEQRASLGAVMIYVFLVQGLVIYRSPVRGLNTLIIGICALAFVQISFSSIYGVLSEKTHNVGLNMRPQEMEAVWEVARAESLYFVFGLGWGASFNSPAVGGLNVGFTHNFFSSVFLKMGLVGVVLSVLYVAGLLERLARVILRAPVIGFALLAPILIDLTLYASFKSFDFGLMLLLISGSLVYFRQSELIHNSS